MSTRVQDLRDERGRVLSEIDEILNTAEQDNDRNLTVEERARHDLLVDRYDGLNRQIGDGGAPAGRFNRVSVSDRSHLRYSLDALLWATPEDTPAGTLSRDGTFHRHPSGAVNPVDQVIVRSQRLGDFPAPRLSEFTPDDVPTIRRFQRLVADMSLFGLMVDRSARTAAEGFQAARDSRTYADEWRDVLRALDVDTTAEGKEFVPTGLGSDLHEKVRASGIVAPLFARIPLPTNPWELPIEAADATAYLVAEPTSDSATKVTASTPGSGKVTFDAEIFGGRVLFSRSVDQDSAVAMVPFVRMKVVQAFVDAEEKAILDGDTAATHQDSDVTGATDTRKAWDGLRKRGLAETNTDAGNVKITLAKIREAVSAMGKYGIRPSEAALIVGVKGYRQVLNLDELLTLDKLGPWATLLNGQLGTLDGMPVIISEHVREDVAADGTHDGITTDRTYLTVVHRPSWALGQRMALDAEVDDSIYRESFQRVLVAFERLDFQNLADTSTNDDTSVLRNIAQ